MVIDLKQYLNQNHYADIEAKGFWDDVNSPSDIWCLCSVTEDDNILLFHDYPEFDDAEVFDSYDQKTYTIPKRAGSLIEGVRFWYSVGKSKGKLVVHNCFGYDKPIIEKIWPKCKIPKSQWHDTFIQSKAQWYERPTPKGCKSPHGLKAYGVLHGINKPEITDWTTMDAYKLHRVIEDCKIQKMTYKYLEKERLMIKDRLNINLDESIHIEVDYAIGCQEQEVTGVLVDKTHMESCVDWLDNKIEELGKVIEPQLPPTLKVKSTKTSRGVMAKLLGYTQEVPEQYDDEGNVIKQYYKPSTNYTKVDKSNLYSGFHISYGVAPPFPKKKELTDWIKENYPDTKPKDWNIEKEEVEKVLLNANTCGFFEVNPEDTDIICGPFTRVEFNPSRMSQHEVVKGFLVMLGWDHAEEWNLKKDSDGQIMRAEADTIVYFPKKASPENQMSFLCRRGEPLVTTPKLTEKDYDTLPEGIGKDIAEYNTYSHRRRFLSNPKDPEEKGLMAYIREDGRIPCGVNNFMTATSRSSHRVWVNAPGEGSLFGEEIRRCIIAPKGRKLVGADMKSAQLSIAAYYAKNSQYYDAVASGAEEIEDDGIKVYKGESAHCFSARLFGMVSDREWQMAVKTQDPVLLHSIAMRRKKSKGASFGVIFGCSGKKLAKMLGVPESEGNKKKELFLSQMGLTGVIEWLKRSKDEFKRAGGWYIPLPFGYWIYCKYDHKAINYIIQGTEAVCQKVAVNYFVKKVKELGLDAKKVLDYHKTLWLHAVTYVE